MTTEQKTDLDALIERVKGASGTDRKIDALLCEAFDLPSCREPDCLPDVMRRLIERAKAGGCDEEVPSYTSSLDAATALAERCLPGWGGIIPLKGGDEAWIWKEDGMSKSHRGNAATPALALVLAILTAIKAQETK